MYLKQDACLYDPPGCKQNCIAAEVWNMERASLWNVDSLPVIFKNAGLPEKCNCLHDQDSQLERHILVVDQGHQRPQLQMYTKPQHNQNIVHTGAWHVSSIHVNLVSTICFLVSHSCYSRGLHNAGTPWHMRAAKCMELCTFQLSSWREGKSLCSLVCTKLIERPAPHQVHCALVNSYSAPHAVWCAAVKLQPGSWERK